MQPEAIEGKGDRQVGCWQCLQCAVIVALGQMQVLHVLALVSDPPCKWQTHLTAEYQQCTGAMAHEDGQAMHTVQDASDTLTAHS